MNHHNAQVFAQDLLHFIDASPTPWHVVASCQQRLSAAGFRRLFEHERWQLAAGDRCYVVRGGSSIIAFIVGQGGLAEHCLRLIGAHTDSPGLRIKPKPAEDQSGLMRLGVEIYGGPILATFSDRDLSLAGRVFFRNGKGMSTQLVHFPNPLLRLPNLAIHMNRDVNESGLKFNKQTELPLLAGLSLPEQGAETRFRHLLARELDIDPEQILSWELLAFDTQSGCLWGAEQEFIADSQLDNLASCHAALSALLEVNEPKSTAICAFFDHEEVGSDSATGAGGSFLTDVIQRLAACFDLDQQDQQRMRSNSFFVSADMAHAWHPNFPAAYEPNHRVLVNHGPVIKHNCNQRYSTNAETAARFIRYCQQSDVPYQQYAHRSDLGCGSTIGPILAAQLGIPSVDVGNPMWAMHSIRESAGVLDHYYMKQVMRTVLQSE